MRFWDSSALVPLLVEQQGSPSTRALLESDAEVAVWLFTDLELRSAFARLEREGHLAPNHAQRASAQAALLWEGFQVVTAIEPVKSRASRLLRVHPLRAADVLQLAAALVAAEDEPLRTDFVTLDVGLAHAALREGFRVLPE